MPTSRRRSQPRSPKSLVSYSTALAEAPITVQVEAEEGSPAPVEEVVLTPGNSRWSGIIGFENEMTGDGRVISEGALRWPEDLEENPIPIRYVSSDVGAHDGAQVVGLIDTIERLPAQEDGSIPIWGEGVFDDAEEATIAQEAFRVVSKKLSNGVSMDLDDVQFEVEAGDNPEQEVMRTQDARVRAVTIVAIPAFAGARINVVSTDSTDSLQTPSEEPVKFAEAEEAPEVVTTHSARGMRAQALTKVKLRRLAARKATFAYQTTKIKTPEGELIETPASAIDVASNAVAPDDPFELGLAALNEGDMLELGSEEYLAKAREALPLFEKAVEAGGDRKAEASEVVRILTDYLAINWPSEADTEEESAVEGAVEGDAELDEVTVKETTQSAAAETETLASTTETLAFNKDQWRNPANGQWIDMPGKILGRLDDYDGVELKDAREAGDSFVKHLNEGDVPGAVADLDKISGHLDAIMNEGDDEFVADAPLIEAAEKIDLLKNVDWFRAPIDSEGVGSFDDPAAEPTAEPTVKDLSDNQLLTYLEAVEKRSEAGDHAASLLYRDAYLEAQERGLLSPEVSAADDMDPNRPIGIDNGRGDDDNSDWGFPEDGDESALDEGTQNLDALEMEYDQDTPQSALDFISALENGDVAEAEGHLNDLQNLVIESGEDLTEDDTEGYVVYNYYEAVMLELSHVLQRWKNENGIADSEAPTFSDEQIQAWAKEFNVPDVQVEDILSALEYSEGTEDWDSLTALAQGFVKLSKVGVDVHEALSIYLKSLEESGRGAVSGTFGARKGQVFNWVDEVGGLPAYIRDIADSLMKRGFSESRAIATAVETVKRWAKGGPARKGGKGSVSAKTVAKAVKALAEWEAKKARANASAAEATALTASAGDGMTQERVHAPQVMSIRQELLSKFRTVDMKEVESLTAAATGTAVSKAPKVNLAAGKRAPVRPPKAWFEAPTFSEATPITVDDDGRVYGHLASWNVCHVASPAGEGVCVMAPKSRTGYAYFHTGAVKTLEGDTIATGRLCMDGRHAGPSLTASQTASHYDDTTLAVADVRVGEDRFGIWVAGAIRPGISETKLRAFRASPLSGDWRRIGGNLELTIGLSVNAPGYPVPRPMGLVASIGGESEAEDHELLSLVAVGMLPPKKVLAPGSEGALSSEDIRYLRSLAQREREAEKVAAQERVHEAAAKMAAKMNREKVAAMAARLQKGSED